MHIWGLRELLLTYSEMQKKISTSIQLIARGYFAKKGFFLWKSQAKCEML